MAFSSAPSLVLAEVLPERLVERAQKIGARGGKDPAAGGEVFEIKAHRVVTSPSMHSDHNARKSMIVNRSGSTTVTIAEATGTSTPARPVSTAMAARSVLAAQRQVEARQRSRRCRAGPASNASRSSSRFATARSPIRPSENLRANPAVPRARRRRRRGAVWMSSPASVMLAPRDRPPRTGAGGRSAWSVRAGARSPDRHARLR
jgi:hypothetical protein